MRFYRALLRAYPASFRAEYGEEMCAIHAQKMRDAHSAALVSILAVFDVLYDAVCVHLDILRHDLRYAARTLSRTPGFALTAIIVAALGIGATTAAFTMMDHVLLRPMPYSGQDRIVKLYEDNSFVGVAHNDVAPANYRDWKRMTGSFEILGAYRGLSASLTGINDPRQVDGAAITAEILPLLGVKPLLGRWLAFDDDRENSAPAAVLSYSLWQTQFGGDASVLGRKIVLDNVAYTVIGVMPQVFYFPSRETQLWVAMRFSPQDFEDRTNTYIHGLGKLKPGVSLSQAVSEMNTIAAQLQRQYPKELAHAGITLIPLREDISNPPKLMLKVVLAAALCVLLVACTNLANLLLARSLARRKELAVRAAMGAGRERLVRQMLTESLLLSIAGGAIGVLIATSSLPLFVRLVPVYLPIAEIPSVDWRVLAFAAFLTITTGIGFGVVPAMRVSRGAEDLREGSRSGVGGRKERLRSILVAAEVAGSVVLLVCCGLLARALWRIQAVDPGFRIDHALTLRTTLPMPKYDRNEAREQFYQRVLSEVRQLPGVTGAAYTSFMPMLQRGSIWPVEVEGRPQPLSERQFASLRFVTPGFFQTMGIPLLAGRDVEESDRLESQFVAVVSEAFVRKYWPDQNPLGRHFDFGNAVRTVVGVVGNVRVRGLERSSEPQVYLPYKQHRAISTWYAPKDLVVRATGDVSALGPALRRIIHDADPDQPVTGIRTLADMVESETTTRRVQLAALGSFAAIAFLLAAIGIHGVLSFTVSNRTQEIGVRMALGATRGEILRMVLGNGVVLAAAGVVFGVSLALGVGEWMRSLLAGVEPADFATFGAVVALCLGMTLLGSLLPAVRAVRVDPVTAIRVE